MKIKLYIPFKIHFALLILVALLPACQEKKIEPVPIKPASTEFRSVPAVNPFKGVDYKQVDAILAGMTLEEKIGQLIVWTPDLSEGFKQKDAVEVVKKRKVGGLLMNQMEVDDFLFWSDSLKRTATIPLLVGTGEKVALHGQFKGTAHFPQPTSIAAIDSAGLQDFLEKEYYQQCQTLGIQFSFRPDLSLFPVKAQVPEESLFEHTSQWASDQLKKNISGLSAKNMIAFADGFSTEHIQLNDSLRIAQLGSIYNITSNGLPGLFLKENIFENEVIKKSEPGFLQKYLANKMGFRGLSSARLMESESPELKLLQGVDLFLTPDVDYFYHHALNLVKEGHLPEKELDARVRRVLAAKAWVHGGCLPVELSLMPKDTSSLAVRLVSFVNKDAPKVIWKYRPKASDFAEQSAKISAYFKHPAWRHFTRGLYEKSVCMSSDLNKLVPLQNLLQKQFNIIEFGSSNFKQFKYYFSKYADFRSVKLDMTTNGQFPTVHLKNPGQDPLSIILLDTFAISPKKDSQFINSVNRLAQENNVVLVNFGDPQALGFFYKTITFFQVFERNEWTESHVAQALFGGVAVNGKLPVAVNKDLPIGASEYVYRDRVSFSGPEQTGIAQERLVGIDAIARTAIRNRVFPGCQVAVIKDGTVVYSKAFGHHTYKKARPVQTTDLYDIASISKIASTTLAIMKLHEQNKISILGKIGDYAQLGHQSTVKNIKVKDLLTHYSGLQAPMPISKFYNYRSVPSSGCNEIFCNTRKDDCFVQISPTLFFREDFQDTIWQRVSHLGISKRRRFRYSDVNFYLLQKAVEDISSFSLDEYVNNHFYQPIGLRHLLYNPSERFDKKRIVPTEQDRMWRKTLVHGFVHDPSAALMGGIGGNAGIFANAEDMAVLFQVLANDGVYGGIQYFDPKTIQTFTAAKYSHHRGLGFDKPTSNRKYPTYSKRTPSTGYGHNGFTGTCVWVDPENDLVYVFLSNRIHPSSQNKKIFIEGIRKRIHDVVYDAFSSFDAELPELGN